MRTCVCGCYAPVLVTAKLCDNPEMICKSFPEKLVEEFIDEFLNCEQ